MSLVNKITDYVLSDPEYDTKILFGGLELYGMVLARDIIKKLKEKNIRYESEHFNGLFIPLFKYFTHTNKNPDAIRELDEAVRTIEDDLIEEKDTKSLEQVFQEELEAVNKSFDERGLRLLIEAEKRGMGLTGQ